MRKNIVTTFILLLANFAHAQIAQWIIPAQYDSIYFANGANLIVTDSVDTKIFWDFDGKRLFASTQIIHPFSEGYAVTTDTSGSVLGFYNTKGIYTQLFEEKKVNIANDYPFFSNGYLIVRRNNYYIVDTQGNIDKKKYLMTYPFHNGYAVCRDYDNPQKQKGTANYLINKNKQEVPLIYNGKTYDPADVDFISSVNDEQVGIVIIRRKIYYFEGEGKELKPLGLPNPKHKDKIIQAKLEESLTLLPDDPHPTIYAKCSKNDQITIRFDRDLVPLEINFNNEKKRYTQHTPSAEALTSNLQAFESSGLFGLSLNGKEILPPQFEAINHCFNDKALVKVSGKYGMIQNIDNDVFTIKIYNGDNIPFRHQIFETTVRIDMPTLLSPDKIDINVDTESGCLIDKISKISTTTTMGNRAEYSCKLTIPNTITSKPSKCIYPIQIIYDGIALLPIQHVVNAWRYNYFNVIINNDEIKIDKANGLLKFPYNINIERFSENETFLLDVMVVPDTLDVNIQKISETRGLCSMPVSQLNEGENLLYIRLKEQGCPPIDFPFSFTYTKPVPKSKHKPEVKENIQVKELEYDLEFPGL